MAHLLPEEPAPKKRSKPKRVNGQGHQRSDGRWVRSVVDSRTGRRVDLYGKTKAEVDRKADEMRARIAKGEALRDSRMKVGAYLDYWLDEVLPGTVRPSTADNYRTIVNSYINPLRQGSDSARVLDRVALTELDGMECQRIINAVGKRGLTAATQQSTKKVLHKALADAVKNGLIPRNAAAGVRVPKQTHKIGDALTDHEAALLLSAIKGHRLEGVFVLCLMLGLRRGEALGLTWDDCDFDAGTLTVRRTLSYRKGEGIVTGPPKSEASRRTLKLPTSVSVLLQARRQEQRKEEMRNRQEWRRTGYVFTNASGGPLHPNAVLKSYQRVTSRIGLGKRRLHGLRHSTATILLEQGVDLAIISGLLGHSNFAVTANIYAEVREKALQQAAEAMERALGAG